MGRCLPLIRKTSVFFTNVHANELYGNANNVIIKKVSYRRQIASRSAGGIADRKVVSALVMRGPTLPSNSSKYIGGIRKYC